MRRLVALLSVATAALIAPASGLADGSPVSPLTQPQPAAAAEAVSSADVAALLADGTPASRITDGQRSPDGKHLLFQLRGGVELPEPRVTGFWVMRSDGTQRKQLNTSWGDYDTAYHVEADWRIDGKIRTAHSNAYSHTVGDWSVLALTVQTGDVDRWAELDPHEIGTVTADGRFRVSSGTSPKASNWFGGSVKAYEIATGTTHVISSWGPAPSSSSWQNGCGDPVRNPEQTVEGALEGPKPACLFARLPGDVDPEPEATDQDPEPAEPVIPPTDPAPATTDEATPPAAPKPAPFVEHGVKLPAKSSAGPVLRLHAVGTRLGGAAKNRLSVNFTAASSTKVRIWLLSGVAGQQQTLAGLTVDRYGGGAATPRLLLSAKARRAVRSAPAGSLTVRVAAIDGAGRRTVVERLLGTYR